MTPADQADDSSVTAIWSRLSRRYFSPLFFILMTARLALAAATTTLTLAERWDNSYPEGAVPGRAWDGARGLPVYRDWRQWPHAFAPYSPLTYYVPAWGALAIGAAEQPWNLYVAGRLQSLVSIFGLACVVALLARRAGASRAWSWLAVCAFLGWDQMRVFMASYRPDAPASLFSLLSIWALLGGRAAPARAAGAILSLSIAFWFKATPWGAAVLLGWWLLATAPNRTAGAAMGIAGLALNLVAAFWLNHATGGALFMNMIGSLDNGIAPENYRAALGGPNLLSTIVLFSGAGAAALGGIGAPHGPDERIDADAFVRRWLSRAAALALACSLGQLLKDGANINYLIEPFGLACAGAASASERSWKRGARVGGIIEACILALWVAVGGSQAFECMRALAGARGALRDGIAHRQDLDVTRSVAAIEGPILAMNPFLSLRRPAPPTVLDWYQWNILVRRGLLDPGPVLDRINSEEFEAVIASPRYIRMDRPTRWIEPLKAAIHRHYEIAEDHENLWLMLPRGNPELPEGMVGPPAPRRER